MHLIGAEVEQYTTQFTEAKQKFVYNSEEIVTDEVTDEERKKINRKGTVKRIGKNIKKLFRWS